MMIISISTLMMKHPTIMALSAINGLTYKPDYCESFDGQQAAGRGPAIHDVASRTEVLNA
jgi:hypothetical protein